MSKKYKSTKGEKHMRLKITGKNITLTEGIKDAVKEKVKKIEKLVSEEALTEVMLSAKHGKAKAQRAEITVKTKKSVVRAEVTDDDLYRAIAAAVDVVAERLKKIKEKSRKRAGSESIRAVEKEMAVREEAAVGLDVIEDFEISGGISREKIVAAESMTRDEACVEMEYTDHDFYVFRDTDRNDMLSVIYRRKEKGYGVLTVPETM